MRALTLVCYVGVFTCSIIACTYATVGGQYSVNVHFVPPLVTAPCQIAQFWTPSNVTCGLCFCMTGTLSRCIPQPGCNPNVAQNATTTTPNPNESASASSSGDESTSSSSSSSSSSPPENENSTDNPTTENAENSSTAAPAQGTPSKLRAAKPGKTRRRRRHVSQHKSG